MDGHRFDILLTQATSGRRSLLACLLAGMLGGANEATAAKRKTKKKSKGKGSKGNDKPGKDKGKASPECTDDGLFDCAQGAICYQGRCVEGCLTSADCPLLYSCLVFEESEVGMCIPGCVDHAYCAQQMGTRLSRCNFTTHQCERIECINDGDCTPPKSCRDNFTCTCPECPQ